MQGSRFCVSLFWNNDYKHLFWWALTLCKCGRSSPEVTKWFAENENKNICSNRSIGNSSFMHKYLSETRLSFWFLESGRKKKVTCRINISTVCIFMLHVAFQHLQYWNHWIQFPAVFVPTETRNNMIFSSLSPEHQHGVVTTWNWKLEKKVATEQRRNTTTTYLYYAETHIANILFIFM